MHWVSANQQQIKHDGLYTTNNFEIKKITFVSTIPQENSTKS